MRAREFIREQSDPNNVIVTNLKNVLDSLRSRYVAAHEEPKVRVDSVVNMVRSLPGSEMFNIDLLMSAYEDDDTLTNLISGIKRDKESDVPYVYLKTAEQDILKGMNSEKSSMNNDEADNLDLEKMNAEKTVDQMSKRAMKKRK